MRRTIFTTALCMSLLGIGAAQADEVVTTTADTYVKKGNKAGYGDLTVMTIKNAHNGDGDNTRKAVFRFANSSMMANAASLKLHATSHDGSVHMYLWGINEGDCAESFNEATAKYNTFPYFDHSDDGVDNDSSCLFDGAPIATFTVNADTDYTISNQALIDFLNADTNGIVTFALTTNTSDGNGVNFASKEYGSYAPSLTTTRFGQTSINDNFVGGNMSESDGVTHFSTGTLKIPLAGGSSLALPIAEADMTFDSQGNLLSFNGTLGGSFSFPMQGLLGALGPLSFDAPSLSIGYGSPNDGGPLGDLDLPFSSRGMRGKYFYLIAESGVGVSWGPLSLSAPVGGETIFVIDPNAPTVYTTSDQILKIPFGIGVSGANALAFTPANNNGVESYLKSFSGNLYLSGALDLPLKKSSGEESAVTATLNGEATLAVDNNAFVSGLQNGDVAELGQWLSKLGANGTLSLSADLGAGITLGFDDIAGSSVLYDSSKPSLAFASGINSGDLRLPSLPFAFNGKLNVSGYINAADLLHSFYQVGGSLKFPNGFLSGNSISATVKYGPTEVGFDGSIKFGDFKFDVSGDATPSRVKVSGSARASIDYTLDYGVGKKKITAHFTIKGSFDSSKSTPDFDFSDLDSDFSDAVGSLTSDGHIKVCIQFPKVSISGVGSFNIGKVCQNL